MINNDFITTKVFLFLSMFLCWLSGYPQIRFAVECIFPIAIDLQRLVPNTGSPTY